MTDYSELKRLAEAVRDENSDWQPAQATWEYHGALRDSTTLLALIAENERLKKKNDNQAQTIREYSDLVMGGDVSLGMLRADLRVTTGERDQLKAEAKALRKDAERYRWASRNLVDLGSWSDIDIEAAMDKDQG